MRAALRGVLPGGLVCVAALGSVALLGDATLDLVTGRYGIVLYAAGAILAAAFHRSRVAAALLAFASVELIGGGSTAAPDPFVALATLLMGFLATLALMRDRGVVARGGLVQLGGAAVVAYVSYRAFDDPTLLAGFPNVRLLPTGLVGAGDVPQATLVVGSASLVAAGYGVYRWRGPVERALFWSALMLLAAVYPAVGRPGAALLLMAGGLVLAVSVLETSYFMAYRDELTELPARRALVRDLGQVGGTYSLGMVDVDQFKQFNDKYGHDVGDQVLHLVASRLASGPGGGKAYRYGGEEFTLMYPGLMCDEALAHAEAVRAAVETATFSLRAWNRPRRKPDGSTSGGRTKMGLKQLSVTVSIGLADSSGKDATPEQVLQKADKALYRAKEGGRNRVAK